MQASMGHVPDTSHGFERTSSSINSGMFRGGHGKGVLDHGVGFGEGGIQTLDQLAQSSGNFRNFASTLGVQGLTNAFHSLTNIEAIGQGLGIKGVGVASFISNPTPGMLGSLGRGR